ncbi:MAG: DUF4118 domain-containing protein [Negativicutes bacterium]|nr:DUF4118 domain-containing protein [Negativicutes bacterium]
MAGPIRQQSRPTPEDILERIHKESRGRLTVFLGAAAGVGKTYAMLEAAHDRLREGIDIVIGWVETHGRQETEKLAEGLTRIPAKAVEYRDKKLPEMDIDAILALKPELVLVDELAHANIPGSRHVRRFQDVEELLKDGINVYTTLNIQHIESLNDVVAQITGVKVRETVPDYIVEQADAVKLIDIPPEELIKRLQEGKVYIPGQAEQALRQFFRQGNINALRELALRFTAERVDKDVNDYMREHSICGPWPIAGRVMVCVSASPFSAQLIRAARRLAGGPQADWLAVHVELERQAPLNEKDRERLARNIRLAEELGAKTFTVVGRELIEEVLEVARSHNIATIVFGKSRHSRWRELIYGSTVDKLIRHSGVINVHVIQGEAEAEQAVSIKTAVITRATPWRHYGGGMFMMAAVTVFSLLVNITSSVELINIALLYQLPVTLSAFWWGRWPSYFTAVCSVLVFDFFFVPPSFNMSIDDIRYLWSFATFLIVAFVIGGRTELLRREATAARVRERSTRALYHFSREIAAITDLKTITRGMAKQATEAINRAVAVLLPADNGRLELWSEYNPKLPEAEQPDAQSPQPLADSAEEAVAAWAYQHGRVAGKSTETLPGADHLYVPLKTGDTIVGLLRIHIGKNSMTAEERRLVDAWTGLAAVAVERALLSKSKQE